MKKLHSLAVYALMAPAVTLGIGSALAQTPPTVTEPTQEQKQRAQDQQQRTMPSQSQRDRGMGTADRAQQQRRDAQRAQQSGDAQGTYLSQKPEGSFRAEELIGSDLKSRSDSDTIGTISDLLIDKDGQIVAVIVEVGDFLGMGEKKIAIAWDSVEHNVVTKERSFKFKTSVNKAALTNAPEYEEEGSY